MNRWVRNAVVLITIAVWAIAVLYNLITNRALPDPTTWLVPPGVWAAVHAPIPGRHEPADRGESS